MGSLQRILSTGLALIGFAYLGLASPKIVNVDDSVRKGSGIENIINTSSQIGVEWVQVAANAPWTPRGNHTSIIFDDKLWVLGGYGSDRKYKNDVWYSTNGTNWNLATNAASWSERVGHEAVVYNDRMWVLGGYGNDSKYKND